MNKSIFTQSLFCLSIILFAVRSPVWAAYKCVENGVTVYRDYACPNGAWLPPAAQPDARVIRQAQKQAAYERKRLDKIEQAEQQQERKQAVEQQRSHRQSLAHKKQCQQLAMKKRWTEEDLANTHHLKKHAAEQRKLRRVEERYQLLCG